MNGMLAATGARARTLLGLRRAVILAGIVALLPALASARGLSGISYTLTPGAEWVQWDDDLGLEDNALYGGHLALNFGRYIALRGYYFGNSEVKTDFSELDLGDGVDYGAFESKVEVTNFGADVSFGLGSGPIVPYVYGGPGIMRFAPDGRERSDQIGLKAGAGLKMRLSNRLEGLVYFEDNMFRMNRGLLLPGEGEDDTKAVDDSDGDKLRHNYGFGAGLGFYLGGYDPSKETDVDRAYRRQFAGGLTGMSFKFEPYAGWLDYDNGIELPDQQFGGFRAGFGIGELADVMGYYWRGVTGDYRKTEQVQSWGGEMDFNLNPGPGVSPRILLGAGSLDYMSGFSGADFTPEDKVLFIAGVGLDFNLARRLRAEVRVRDYMFSETDVSETTDPDQILHNWAYSAGLTFGFGGRGAGLPAIEEPGLEPRALPPLREENVERTEILGEGERPSVEKKVIVKRMMPCAPEAGMMEPSLAARAPWGPRMVTIPAPTTGEIYIRYGEPGAVTIESRTAAAPAEPAEKALAIVKTEGEPEGGAPAAVEGEAVRSPEEDSLRIERQLERFETRLLEKIDRRITRKMESEAAAPAAPAPPSAPSAAPGKGGMSYKRTLAYAGANVDKPRQFVLGARLEMGPVGSNANIDFLPEVGFGLFNESSILLAANIRWDLGETLRIHAVNPYVYGGPGLLFFNKKFEGRDKTEGVLNLGYGVSKEFGDWTGFLEHQGVDIYSLHRILVGTSMKF